MRKKIIISISSVAAGVLLIIVFVICLLPYLQNPSDKKTEGSSYWMKNISDETYISSLNIPGAHDATTNYVTLPYFSKCQSTSVYHQLNDGVRYLDIRLSVDKKKLKLTHGSMNCRNDFISSTMHLDSVLKSCYQFLDENPSETILFVAKAEQGESQVSSVESLLQNYIKENKDRWYTYSAIPKMKDVRNKIILMRRWNSSLEDGECGIDVSWAEQKGHDDTSLNSDSIQKGSYTLSVQDRYCYGVNDKWNAFTEGLKKSEKNDNNIAINFLSTKGTFVVGHPYKYAKKLNKKLLDEDLSKYDKTGCVVMDYVTSSLCRKIYSTNY